MSELVLNRADKARAIADPVFLRRSAAVALSVAVAYYFTVRIGFAFALQPGSVSTLWMPNSILLAGLLLTPTRYWWIVIAAVFPAHVASELNGGVPIPMVLSWFLSNSVQAVLGATCIRWLIKGPLRFDSLRHFTTFVVFGVFLAPFLASFLDIELVRLNNWGTGSYGELWRVRFLANVVASLTLVPVILTWSKGGLGALRSASARIQIEAVLLALGLFVVSKIVFNEQFYVPDASPSVLYWPLPFLLWAALRFGPRGTSTSILIVMFLVIWGAVSGHGPFVTKSATDNVLSIQWFLIVLSIPMMALAAVIQERERAKETARQKEEHLAMALDAAQMGTWDWHVDDSRVKWSDETKRIFGLSPEDPELSTEGFYDLLHPHDRQSIEQAVNRAVCEGSPYEAEFRIPQSNGSIRWVRGKGKVQFDVAGKPLRLVGVNADITERKNAEEALRETEARLARTEAFSLVMTTHMSLDGKWLKVPPTLCELVGYSEDELLAGSFKDITHPDDIEADWSQCLRLIRGEIKSFDLEKRYIHKNGKIIWVYLNCSVVEDKEGKPVHFLTYIKDITEQKLASEALTRSEENLRQSNRQISDLATRLLRAQEAERRRISLQLHDDLSQNIAALSVAISRLKRKLPGSREQITAELDLLNQHTNDLTTQIRLLSHQLHPAVLEHLGLVAALESQVTDLGQKEEIEVTFAAEVRSETIPLEVSACIYRVAVEALRNVARHSGAKSARMLLTEDDRFLTLEVSDSGKGFDVEEPKREIGLGLVSAEERVKLLQGSFEIRSTPQIGTTLVARIPIAR